MNKNLTITVTVTEEDETGIQTKTTEQWTLEKVLDYINFGRNADWVYYDHSDWHEGWEAFVQDNSPYSIDEKDLRADFFN